MKKTLGLILISVICVITVGCKKNDLEGLLEEIQISDEVITESFSLPKYIMGREVSWEASDSRIIKILDQEDAYKAVVLLPEYDMEVELIVSISDGLNHFERKFPVIVARDDYALVSINEIKDLNSGALVKLDLVVIFSEEGLFVGSDGTGSKVFKVNHDYQVGDRLIIKVKANDFTEIISYEKISSNHDYDPFKNIAIKSVDEVNRMKPSDEGSLFRVIGKVIRVNGGFYLASPKTNSELIEFGTDNISDYEGDLIECLVLISNGDNGVLKLISTRVYMEYQYYDNDYQLVKHIIDDINNIFKGVITEDILLPLYDKDDPVITWKMDGFDLSNGIIKHPGIDCIKKLEVRVQIGEAVIVDIIDIKFIASTLLRIKEAKDSFLKNGIMIVLIKGEVVDISNQEIILSDGEDEISITGLVDVNMGEELIIKGEIIDLNTIRLIDYW